MMQLLLLYETYQNHADDSSLTCKKYMRVNKQYLAMSINGSSKTQNLGTMFGKPSNCKYAYIHMV